MIGLTLAAVVITVYHPIAWSDDEVRFAVGAPAALGHPRGAGRRSPWAGPRRPLALGPVKVTPLEAGFGLVVVGLAVYAAFTIGGLARASGRWRPAAPRGRPPAGPAARVAGTRGLGPPRLGLRAAGRLARSDRWSSSRWSCTSISYIPWALIEGHQLWDGWPARPHRPDAHPAHRRDVRVPQQPDGGARRQLAVVGVAAQPQARLVLPGLVRRRHRRPPSTTPATW